jgi:hypothetical protein
LATRTLRMRGTGALFTGFHGRLEEDASLRAAAGEPPGVLLPERE